KQQKEIITWWCKPLRETKPYKSIFNNCMPNKQLKTAALEKSSHLEYFNIAVSVDCVIFGYDEKKLKVLLIKSDLEEFEGLYSLLGDLVRPDEDMEDAPYRVLRERTGLQDVYLEQV